MPEVSASGLPERRRLLSHALASVVAARGQVHLSDEDVFAAITLPSMTAAAHDAGLDEVQRGDVARYLASLGDIHAEQAAILHEEARIALRPSLICMRWPDKTS